MTLTILSNKMKKKENAFIRKLFKCCMFHLVFVIKLGGRMTEIFSVGLQRPDKGLKA